MQTGQTRDLHLGVSVSPISEDQSQDYAARTNQDMRGEKKFIVDRSCADKQPTSEVELSLIL